MCPKYWGTCSRSLHDDSASALDACASWITLYGRIPFCCHATVELVNPLLVSVRVGHNSHVARSGGVKRSNTRSGRRPSHANWTGLAAGGIARRPGRGQHVDRRCRRPDGRACAGRFSVGRAVRAAPGAASTSSLPPTASGS
jgi:hypothetical protein